jgi:hypothetical protein
MIIDREALKKHSGSDYYDGVLLHARWAYQILGAEKVLPIGNVIAFRSPMKVDIKFMIDVEDRIAKDFIHSDDAINFVWEIPDISPIGGVYFQRLFATAVGNILSTYVDSKVEIDGDDIIVHKEHTQNGVTQLQGKASVSISCFRNNAVLGHLGINVVAGSEAPVFAYSSNLTDEQCGKFMVECNNAFYEITKSCFIATTKVI